MTSNLDSLITKVKDLARSGQRREAMELAKELVEKNPGERRVWSLRAFLHALNRNYGASVADLTRAIEIGPAEPLLFFNRGSYYFRLGEDQSAIDDFSKGLYLCERHNDDVYRQTLYFWRAEASLRLGKKREALSDLAHVRDDFTFWTDRLRTKSDLVDDCR